MPPWTRRARKRRARRRRSERSPAALRPLDALLRGVRGPVVLERDDELEPQVHVVVERPGERRPHVVALRDDEVVPHRPLGVRCEIGRKGDRKVVLGVSAAELGVFASSASRSAASSLIVSSIQKRGRLVTPAEEALVEEGLQRVRIGVADSLGGLV